MVLFIFFNDIGLSIEQWKKHPFDSSVKSTLLSKLKKFGDTFVYNPVFYNFQNYNCSMVSKKYNENYKFSIKQVDLEEHCKKLFTEVYPLDDEFILISHSAGYLFSHTFANMYADNVKAIININGGFTKEWIKLWLTKEQIQFIKKIKDRDLNELFDNLEKNRLIPETLKLLDQIVKYNIFKQYNTIEHKLNCPIYIFTNIDTKYQLETLDKFKFNNDISKLNEQTKTYFFLDKSDFLYFDIDKQICETISEIVNNLEKNKI